MESMSSLEEWAQSLVHRDWEIFWSHRDECTRLPCQQKQQEKQPAEVQLENYLNNEAGEELFSKVVEDIEMEQCEVGESSEEQEDVDDWYDGHVEGINARKENGKYSFQVTFVGDEKLYTMVLLNGGHKKHETTSGGQASRTRRLKVFYFPHSR